MKPRIPYKDIEKYYQHKEIVFNIQQWTYKKEIVFIPHKDFKKDYAINRMRRGHNMKEVNFLRNVILNYPNKKIPFNWYMSVAKYKEGIPKIKIAKGYKEQNEIIRKQWEQDHTNHIEEFKYFIDIDAPTHEDLDIAVEDTQKIRDYLLKNNEKFIIIFSGCGFHIHVENNKPNQIYEKHNPNNVNAEYLKRSEWLIENISEFVDLKVYDMRRVCKIPYTLSIYPDRIYVCKPITHPDQLNNFDISRYQWLPYIIPEINKPYKYGE